MEIKYNGNVVGKVTKEGIQFISGPDLNPAIDDAIGSINQVEDDMGNIIFEKGIPSLSIKLMYMVEVLGFEIDEITEIKKKSIDTDVPKRTDLEKILMSNYKDLEKQILEMIE